MAVRDGAAALDVRWRAGIFALLCVIALSACMPERRPDPKPVAADTGAEDAGGGDDASAGDAAVDTAGDVADSGPIPVGCESHAECSKADPPVCKVARCNFQTGLCFAADEPDGKDCGDGDPCKVDPQCQAGACVFAAKACNDDNPCSTDSCATGTGCLYLANDNACDDGDPCTEGDRCEQLACKGKPRVCLGAVPPCIVALCIADKGCEIRFAEVQAGAPVQCDDDNKCTEDDVCAKGKCKGKAKACTEEEKPCQITSCQPNDGTCATFPVSGLACDDGDLCTVSEACEADGACKGVEKDCDDGNPCTVDGCFAKTGCFSEPTGGECDDGDACTLPDACTESTCKGGEINCDDGNVCTNDTCDKAFGCQFKTNLEACSDGDVCTETDSCQGGVCKGSPVSCADDNACTADSCGASGCTFKPLANATSCAGGGQCWAGECVVAECGNTSCEYNETTSSCPKDCPEGGGLCAENDASCLATCAGQVCGDQSKACDADTECGKLDTCVEACSEEACELGCLAKASTATVKVWRAQRNCLAAKCKKNGWAGKNCKAGAGSFPACVAACRTAVCYVEEVSCYAKVGCQGIDFCVNQCTDGTPSCVKKCFDFGSAEEVELYDQLTACMNVKCL
jgi:hypothetical protein